MNELKRIIFEKAIEIEENIERDTELGLDKQANCKRQKEALAAIIDILQEAGLVKEYQKYKDTDYTDDFFEDEEDW